MGKELMNYVADKDLSVMLVLRLDENGKYYLPHEDEEIVLPSMLERQQRWIECEIYDAKEAVEKTNELLTDIYPDSHAVAVEAFIPKGEEFIVNEDLTKLCARRYKVTDRILADAEISPFEGFFDIVCFLDTVLSSVEGVNTEIMNSISETYDCGATHDVAERNN